MKSQEGFADLVGLHRTYIGSVERGEKNISFINLYKIAEKLQTSLSDLLVKISD
jgi:transcriptional regulator with XRE-family HTH domain